MSSNKLIGMLFVLAMAAQPSAAIAKATGFKTESVPMNVPLLTLKKHSPVMRVRIVRPEVKNYKLKDLTFSLTEVNAPGAVMSASLFAGTRSNRYRQSFPDSLLQTVTLKNGKLRFSPKYTVKSDTLDLWLTLRLKDDAANPDARINVACTKLGTSVGALPTGGILPTSQRVGVAVRQSGQDGVNTSRIPGLITTTRGSLIALYDARNESDDDLQGDMDIAINRSEDGGRTWGPIIKVLDMGRYGGLPERYNGVSDGSILCDPRTGTLYATGLWMHGILDPKSGKWVENLNDTSRVWNHQWRSFGSQPGYDIKRSCQFLMAKSTDDGKTWSAPINITRQVKDSTWWLLAPAPGRGIITHDGTLVFPAEGRDEKGEAFSTIIYSRDGGESWKCGRPATYNTNECQVVELPDHSLMLNARHRANRRRKEGNGRAVAVTSDWGATWTQHPTSRKALIECACQASLHRHEYVRNGEKKQVLIFSNPSDTDTRIRHTIKLSFDNGMTWPEKYWTLLDSEWGAGYSCLTSIDDETIGIFYEGSQADIQFQAIRLSDLLKETDK